MKRRSFIKNISVGTAGALTLGGIPVNILAANSRLAQAALNSSNDNVLIFIQLHGGNDALNTLIPVSQYNEYYSYRENIAIPDYGPRSYINLDESIDETSQIGLHPDMKDFKTLYDQGKAIVVQNVGYPGMNMSHFRGRDLVFMGLDGNSDTDNSIPESHLRSGWMGRFLDEEYPNYPDDYPSTEMPDPIAIEMGTAMSLAFHRSDNIPIGLNIDSPQAFYDLINSVDDLTLPDYNPGGYAGNELEYLWQFEGMTREYAGRLRDVYDAGSETTIDYRTQYPLPTSSIYRNNPLAGQLKLIARLLGGGIKTRIFLCRIGGFDTHANQVEGDDSTLGIHSALLYHLSSSIKDFQDDLAARQLEDKVLTMTFTEFGRRVYANESYGTDHGTSTPVFIFGKALDGKVIGKNPDLSNLVSGNMVYDIDYRQIYTRIVLDWFGADEATMQETGFSEWVDSSLALFAPTSLEKQIIGKNGALHRCWPIPATDYITIGFFLERISDVEITIYDSTGKQLFRSIFKGLHYGPHKVTEDISSLSSGNYIYKIKSKSLNESNQFIVK